MYALPFTATPERIEAANRLLDSREWTVKNGELFVCYSNMSQRQYLEELFGTPNHRFIDLKK